MSERKVDREAWSEVIKDLIDQEAKGNKSAFARVVGLPNTRSIDRWLAGEVNVSEDSIRQVCRALGLSLPDMLIKVGYLLADELPAGPDATDSEDAVAAYVEGATDIPPALRRQILAHLAETRADQERQRLAQAEQLIEIARRTGRAG